MDRIDILQIDGEWRIFINGGGIVNRKGQVLTWPNEEAAIAWLERKKQQNKRRTGTELHWKIATVEERQEI